MIKLMIADDHAVILEGLKQLIALKFHAESYAIRHWQLLVGVTGRFWPILLKKSVSERAAFRQLKNHSFLALLRKNQDRSVF